MATPANSPPLWTKITHRDLRKHSAAVLARVAAGEQLLITNNGQPAAYLVPIAASTRDRLIAAGRLQPRRQALDISLLGEPVDSDIDLQAGLDDDRGE